MNIKQFLGGFFSNRNMALNGEVKQARETGEYHADMVIGAYLDGFEDRTARLLSERRQRLIGFTPDEIEGETVEDFTGYSRPELMRLAKERGLDYDRSSTKEELVKLLS